jgi:hypothetical protein
VTSRFSRGLTITLVITLVGGVFTAARVLAGQLSGGQSATAVVLAIAVVALLFLPVHMHIERLVDRLLGANRSTSYEGLAGLTALSRATSSDASNLDGVAEAVARKLGARTLPPDRQLSRAARSHVLVAAR